METTNPPIDTTNPPVDTTDAPVDTTESPGGAVPFKGDAFYAAPEPLPADGPGTQLRSEPIDVFGGWYNFRRLARKRSTARTNTGPPDPRK
jgi:hypothetical protein